MTPVGYIISVTASASNRQVAQTVLKIAGPGQAVFGLTTEAVSTDLFVIPAGKKSMQELTTQLQAVPDFSKVAIVALSKPINETELSEVREIFAGLDWDASSVSDDELSLFINDKLLGQYTYYLDLDHKKYGSGPISMHIKGLEDHPPPPPPPAPTNLKQMTDIQIRHWMRKNDTRILKDEDIEIKRSSKEILITIMVDEGVETMIYKLTT